MNHLTQQLADMRRYTLMVLDDIRDEDWFRFPQGCQTHIAWQVGHLALAEYGLNLKSVRGERESDESFITTDFRQTFKRGSTPQPADATPTVEVIRKVFADVHEQAMREVPEFGPELLAEKVSFEHPLFETKRGAIVWCVHHEMTHAGQIALIRRLLGYPIRF